MGYSNGLTWSQWLVDDQREASGRTDVLVFTTDVLKGPVKISGQPMANLMASTSGTDSDWVVKLIDVYPDEVAGQSNMGGYQLMVSADIFRGRYRESFETAKAIASDKPLLYRFALPAAISRPIFEGRCAEGGYRAGVGLRDGDEQVAAAAELAHELRRRLQGANDTAVSERWTKVELLRSGGERECV